MSNYAAGFQALLHIWSTKKNLQPQAIQHPGIHVYSEKGATLGVSDFDPYVNAKRKYISTRGIPWGLSNKKYRETLQEFEELLERQFVACISWKNTQTAQLMLSNATLVTINITSSPDIERIFIDKSLVKKLPDYISDGIIEENFIIFSFLEKLQIVLVNFSNKSNISEWRDGDRLISTYEPKLSFIDLPGPTGFRAKRNCICNKEYDLVCIWWAFSSEQTLSWSPSAKDINRSNVVWLSLTGISGVFTIELVSHMRTDGDLLDAVFSVACSNQVLTIEQSQSSSTNYLVDTCTYELAGRKVCKVDCTTIATKSEVVCQSRNYTQNKLILACRNGSLILWDEYKRVPTTKKAKFVPCHVSWHPNDTVFLLSNTNGDMQVFDVALNCLSLQLVCEVTDRLEYLRLSQYFYSPPNLRLVSWACDSGVGQAPDTICCCDDIMLVFERGPVCVLRFELGVCTGGLLTPLELVCEYIKYEQLNDAVALLMTMQWNSTGLLCFQCLILITDCLFKLPFNARTEECLENTLGSFYMPAQPLHDDIILQYRDDVNRIARKFFHLLLRYKRFKKAFLLAVDIGSKDLFMDIHYLALDVGDHELAEASRKRAFDIHAQETEERLEGGSDIAFDNELKDMYYNFDDLHVGSPPKFGSPPKLESLHPVQSLSPQYRVLKAEKFEFNDSDEESIGPLSVIKPDERSMRANDTLSISSSMSRRNNENTYIVSFANV